MPMKLIKRHISPDRQLVLVVGSGEQGELVVGFEGGTWHTHPDCLASWLDVPESEAIAAFVDRLLSDDLPIITSTDGGQTFDPWVSDNLSATLDGDGEGACVLRYWSGAAYSG